LASSELWVCHLGTVEYRAAMAMQERVRDRRQAGEIPDALLLLDHPPVYTRGRRSDSAELPMGEDWYRSQGIDVVPTDRGGKVTYHGPGQLVGYPIVAITDVLAYLRTMEAAIIGALAAAGVPADVREGLTGVWTGDRKIASIGVHVSRGVTTHGFAVNVENDLQPFSWVVPCGLDGVSMTSVSRELRQGLVPAHPMACFRRQAAHAFCEAFGRRQRLVSAARLGLPGAPLAAASAPARAMARAPGRDREPAPA
jgi:lipoyl(octanoyl) transferase